MNKTVEEMALEKCQCSLRCKCTLSHEGGGCDGQGCPCWCHRTKDRLSEEELDTIRWALEKVKKKKKKKKDGEETEE